ncbi:uncharacterized protein LOC143852482 [Tasmannia lanceolata]|uniref:uncharacterized protein LOC143852482 n=1 Tax=Tasmannia lanceolata TaxID=3420 RepID=UPI0040644057
MPPVQQYDGTSDPVDHLETFRTLMLLHRASDGFLCRAFPTSLTGAARDWYSRLKPNSVDSFGDFMSSRRPRKTAASLMALHQEDDESLKEFIRRFNREGLQVPNLDPSAATNALLAGAKSIEFRRTVARRNPHSLADLIAGAEEYISIEETLAALDSGRRKIPEEVKNPKKHRDDKPIRKERSPERRERNFTPLNTSRNRILAAIRGEDFLKWQDKMLTKGNKRDKSKYCRFHKDHGHDTNDCRHLKEEIELLIQRGYLRKYVEHDNLMLPHDDALAITMLVADWELKKILVDNGSSADILYYNAFKQTMIGDERLKPANSDLFGFFVEIVKVEGQIELPVLVGEPPHQAFAMINFLVVRGTSAYNAILGRPGQNLLHAIASAYHQKMKFITPSGVGEVKGDQLRSRECYATALKGKNATEALPIEF